ncbi:MAG: putative heme d1 biosynthesis radical SAM protein NirJ2 [Candidatus Saccharibacteria bacterium]
MLISWNTTNYCNMFCDHCYREAGDRLPEELNTQQGFTLIDQIKEAGFRLMIFSGGEPLTRPDIFELCAHASSIGLRTVMGTNGTLITPEVARKLKDSGVSACAVSLDSLYKDQNDNFRKLEGAYDMALAGMHNLKDVGIAVQLNTTVMDWNAPQLEGLTDLAVDLGAIGHHVLFLVPTGRAIDIEQEALRVREYERTLNQLMDKSKNVNIELKPTCAPQFMRIADRKGIKTKYSRGCLAGISYCIISPKGDVQPCAYLNMPLGNVKETSFVEIWQNNPVFQKLRTLKYGGKCGECDYAGTCGGCRARAYYYSNGDFMAQDDWCLYQPKGKD